MGNPILKRVVLGETENHIVEQVVRNLSLGERGFSAAVRFIIRDWKKTTGTTEPADGRAPQPATDGRE